MSAQRLAASKVGTEATHLGANRDILCSTPGGIKGWDSNAAADIDVLLAQCSTPGGIKGWDSPLMTMTMKKLLLCSTPGGIKGWDSSPLAQCSGEGSVLNAWRHQRLGQLREGDAYP